MNAPAVVGRGSPAVLAGVVQPLRSILVLADFSPKSDNAVARAALLAREHGASLHLLHVLAPGRFAVAALRRPRRDDAQLALERARRALAALATRTAEPHGVAAACSVRAGDALQAILEAAHDADLVIVAAKRSNPLRDFVLRTPTERLLRMLQRPVLIVKRPAVARYGATLVRAAEAPQGGVAPAAAAECAASGADELVVVAKDGHGAMRTLPARQAGAAARRAGGLRRPAAAGLGRRHGRSRARHRARSRRQARPRRVTASAARSGVSARAGH